MIKSNKTIRNRYIKNIPTIMATTNNITTPIVRKILPHFWFPLFTMRSIPNTSDMINNANNWYMIGRENNAARLELPSSFILFEIELIISDRQNMPVKRNKTPAPIKNPFPFRIVYPFVYILIYSC